MTITIPLEPHGQGRGRATSIGGHARIYDPAKSRSWKNAAARHMREQGPPVPFSGPVHVTIEAWFKCPTGGTKADRSKARYRDKKPDWDNIAKAVCDAGNKILWYDDAQIVEGTVVKMTCAEGDEPCVIVRFTRVGDVDQSYSTC